MKTFTNTKAESQLVKAKGDCCCLYIDPNYESALVIAIIEHEGGTWGEKRRLIMGEAKGNKPGMQGGMMDRGHVELHQKNVRGKQIWEKKPAPNEDMYYDYHGGYLDS